MFAGGVGCAHVAARNPEELPRVRFSSWPQLPRSAERSSIDSAGGTCAMLHLRVSFYTSRFVGRKVRSPVVLGRNTVRSPVKGKNAHS
jgi:hypothetical protein